MSQENVDAFLEGIEAVNRRDMPGILRFSDPEVQFEPRAASIQGAYVGHDAVRDFYADVWETFEVFQAHVADIRDYGDQLLAVGTLRLRGMGSGIETEAPVAIVARYRDGLITHFKDYGDENQALEAIGPRA